MPSSRAARVTALLLLAVLVMLGLNLKVRLSTSAPRFDPGDETGYYRAESALQYRYARLAAQGQPLPDPDRDAQYPEGIRTGRELTSWMERLTGASYRWFGGEGTDFRWFVLLWVGLVSSLAMPAFYLCAWRLTRSQAASLSAAAAYGLSWAAQANMIGAYRLETLGLPLLFASLACCGAALDPEEKRPHPWGAAAAAALFCAFGCWHLSGFYWATYMACAGWAYWRNRDARLKLALAYPAAGAAAALFLIPSVREGLLIGSPGSYGHVYGLLLAKLLHGLRHPADPSQLSPVMRLEWTGPSNSPDAGFAIFAFLPLALMAAPRLWSLLRGARREEEGNRAFASVVDGLFLFYLAAALLASRMMPWLAFFLGLFSLRLPRPILRSPRLAAAFAVIAALEALKCASPASLYNPFMRLSAPFSSSELRPTVSFSSERELLGWLARSAGPWRPTLAGIGLSAEILTYARTPVLLQPKFEAPGIREKTAAFARALYEPEEAFERYCLRYGAKLFVYGVDGVLDETSEGLRYASGRLALRPDSAAFLFHFKPQALTRFRLVFQNEDYRVYAVEPRSGAGQPPPLAVYDLAQYKPAPRPDGSVSLDVAGVLRRMELSRVKLLLGRILSQLGRGEEALSAYDESFAAWPPDPAARAEHESLRDRLLKAK